MGRAKSYPTQPWGCWRAEAEAGRILTGKEWASLTRTSITQKGHSCSTTTVSTLQGAPQMKLEKSHDKTFPRQPNNHQSMRRIYCTQNAQKRTRFTSKQESQSHKQWTDHWWQHRAMFHRVGLVSFQNEGLAEPHSIRPSHVRRVNDSNDNICWNCLISPFFEEGRYSTDQPSLFNHRGDIGLSLPQFLPTFICKWSKFLKDTFFSLKSRKEENNYAFLFLSKTSFFRKAGEWWGVRVKCHTVRQHQVLVTIRFRSQTAWASGPSGFCFHISVMG